eukprot:scaffold122302_cov34-Attheya_sp.AAC.2
MRLYPSRTIAGLEGTSPPSVTNAAPAQSCLNRSSIGMGRFHAAPIQISLASKFAWEISLYVLRRWVMMARQVVLAYPRTGLECLGGTLPV